MSSLSNDHGTRKPKFCCESPYDDVEYDAEKRQQIVADQDLTDQPLKFTHLLFPVVSPYLTMAESKWLRCRPRLPNSDTQDFSALPVVKLPFSKDDVCRQIQVRKITDEKHPAYGQYGLFAARDLRPGDLVIPYIGYVHSSTHSENTEYKSRMEHEEGIVSSIKPGVGHAISSKLVSAENSELSTIEVHIGSWDVSSYDLNLHRDETIELAIDAAWMGNEARFCNDYRNVPVDTNSLAFYRNQQWDRKTKRAAKSWNVENSVTDGLSQAYILDKTQLAMPNAEFRDVWLEWAVDSHSYDLEQKLGDNPQSDDQNTVQNKMESLNAFPVGDDNEIIAGHQEVISATVESNNPTKEFNRRKRRKKHGMRGIAIFVLPAGKSGKRKSGIRSGQEILVSYGKGFWAHHGNQAS